MIYQDPLAYLLGLEGIALFEALGVSGGLPDASVVSPALVAELREPAMWSAPNGPLGIPAVVLDAYIKAAQSLATSDPACGLGWSVLAGIGRIESDHAEGGRVYPNGDTVDVILGPRLDGTDGTAAVPAIDGGRWTGDPVWQHAVGPMQFIPSTWLVYGGDRNPNNVYDAALAAGRYLCAGGGDLRDPRQLAAAVFRYNHSDDYVRTVLQWAQAYSSMGATPLPANGAAPTAPGSTVLVHDPLLPLPPAAPTSPATVHAAPPPSAPPASTPTATTPASPPPSSTTPSPTAPPPPTTTPAPTTSGSPPPSCAPSAATATTAPSPTMTPPTPTTTAPPPLSTTPPAPSTSGSPSRSCASPSPTTSPPSPTTPPRPTAT